MPLMGTVTSKSSSRLGGKLEEGAVFQERMANLPLFVAEPKGN